MLDRLGTRLHSSTTTRHCKGGLGFTASCLRHSFGGNAGGKTLPCRLPSALEFQAFFDPLPHQGAHRGLRRKGLGA